jgi:SPP1 family predicted phage head-tail adaptor
MLRAGSLNCRITIQRQERVRAGGGQVTGQWVEHAQVWANFRRPTGIGAIKADADVALLKASVRIRYRTDISDAMRIVYAGTVFDIKAVIPDLDRREHVDLVVQSLPGGAP